ncbi:MAG: cytidylate kinase-like family protein [Clostridiales bacterium]|nr:cytidylate kinase-like family protein [Clostridiales bacterium]
MDHYVITIARGYGSGGKTIGKMLSEKLDIPFYDRELLRMASDDSGIHERLFGQADERVKPGLRKPFGKVYKGELLPPESDDFVSDDNLFNYQAKIIKELADTRSCVIVGRCADFILQDRPNVVKLFVHAPFESCVKTVMDMYALPQKEAEKKIQDTDRHRSAYYKYYTRRNWDNAQNYDLCLNSAELGFDKCVEIVEAYMNIRFK